MNQPINGIAQLFTQNTPFIEENLLTMDFSNLADRDTPVETLINQILEKALNQSVSDIHFEPLKDGVRVRYRKDGLLAEITTLPLSIAHRINARIKVLANLDIAEHRLPQDGRFQLQRSKTIFDFRVSSCPTIHGEKIVIRLLNSITGNLQIDALDFNPRQKEEFLDALKKPQGLILITGPTGSGKSFSMYTAISYLNSEEKNIITVEEPVEIQLNGINQINAHPKIGLSFSALLPAILRQDPDVIMIGEIRDSETAKLAINAAQTGHLVLSTLHTNSAVETLTRLMHLGISFIDILSSASLVIAQRLVRRLCDHCKQEENDPKIIKSINIKTKTVYKAIGCEHCNKGYQGRIAVFESFPIRKKTSLQIISKNKSSFDFYDFIQNQKITSLFDSGLEKVAQGLTTLNEIQRIILA